MQLKITTNLANKNYLNHAVSTINQAELGVQNCHENLLKNNLFTTKQGNAHRFTFCFIWAFFKNIYDSQDNSGSGKLSL